jgi:hypothetical protein
MIKIISQVIHVLARSWRSSGLKQQTINLHTQLHTSNNNIKNHTQTTKTKPSIDTYLHN